MAENTRATKNKNTRSSKTEEEPRAKKTCDENSVIFTPGSYHDICSRLYMIENKANGVKNGSVTVANSDSYSIANKIDPSILDARINVVSAFNFERYMRDTNTVINELFDALHANVADSPFYTFEKLKFLRSVVSFIKSNENYSEEYQKFITPIIMN